MYEQLYHGNFSVPSYSFKKKESLSQIFFLSFAEFFILFYCFLPLILMKFYLFIFFIQWLKLKVYFLNVSQPCITIKLGTIP